MTNDTLTKAQFLADGVESEECSICQEQYGPNHLPIRIRSCGHVFGRPCLENWTNHRGGNTCPHCRRQLFRRPRARPDHDALLRETRETRERAERAMHRDQERRWNNLAAQTDESGIAVSSYNGWINFFDGVIVLVAVYQAVKYLWQCNEISYKTSGRLRDGIQSRSTNTNAQTNGSRLWKNCSWNCKASAWNYTFCATNLVWVAIVAFSSVQLVSGILQRRQFRRQFMASQVVDEEVQPRHRENTPRDSPALLDNASASYSEYTLDPHSDLRSPALRMQDLQAPFPRSPSFPGHFPDNPLYLDSPGYSDLPYDPNPGIVVPIDTDDELGPSQEDSLASHSEDSQASYSDDSRVPTSDDSLPYTSDNFQSAYSDDSSEFLSEYTLNSTSEFEDYW
ncbi:hypothetical protein BCR34DRAFT_632053 [Clohesyomyces aquaticus]|uniref:RING-type domain-containing protein n=1 Tax=Clohesyomyces aquaticus TaxID=1231657 RepID=A0A1Y1Z9R1_9PLEO|nr:hypothetical protein BCR34DRAFT_632053 [Clohesyomyces aquaticus]